MAQMANATIKSGTFTGDGTINVSLPIGFEPDGVIITTDVDWTVAGWTGIITAILIKGVCGLDYCHTGNTATNAQNYGRQLKLTDDPWAVGAGTYMPNGTYTNGVLNVSNNTNTPSQTYANGRTYTWTAYKA